MAGLVNHAVSLAAQAQEVIVLADHFSARPREVQRERGHAAAQVIHLKDQVIRQVRMLAPDHPAHAQRRQARTCVPKC